MNNQGQPCGHSMPLFLAQNKNSGSQDPGECPHSAYVIHDDIHCSWEESVLHQATLLEAPSCFLLDTALCAWMIFMCLFTVINHNHKQSSFSRSYDFCQQVIQPASRLQTPDAASGVIFHCSALTGESWSCKCYCNCNYPHFYFFSPISSLSLPFPL